MTAICGYHGATAGGVAAQMLALMRHRGGTADAIASTAAWTLACNAAPTRAGGIGRSADGRVTCVLDGRLFDADALRRRIGVEGLDDASLVAECLARAWTEALAWLDGAYALAATCDDRLLLARDPLGEKPLYHARIGSRHAFASEIKALLGDPEFVVRPDHSALVALLVFSFIPGQTSMFTGVHELEPGHHLVIEADGRALEPSSHWHVVEDILPGELPQFAREIETLCDDAVARRLPADGRVCAFLSGGVDSSAVVALLARRGVAPVCFSAAFGDGMPNEIAYARMVADHCGVEHRVLDVDPVDFLPILPRVMWNLDDPLCDCITVPNYMLAQAAAAEAKVVFNGEGGDPLFGGPKNKFLILGEWYRAYGEYDRARAYLASYHKFYEHLDELCTPELLGETGGTIALEGFVRPYLDDPRFGSFLNRLMHLNIRLKGGQNILVKVDKMLAANGVEAASPLFDRRLAEYSLRIPPTLKRKGDVEKYAFKKAIEHLLPHEVVYRKKAGMGVPLNHWFRREPLKGYTADILLSARARSRGYFAQGFVERLVAGRAPASMIGRDRTGELLWMLLAIELWHRVYVDGERPA